MKTEARLGAETTTELPGSAPVEEQPGSPLPPPADADTDRVAAGLRPIRFARLRGAVRGDRIVRHLPIIAVVVFATELRALATIEIGRAHV